MRFDAPLHFVAARPGGYGVAGVMNIDLYTPVRPVGGSDLESATAGKQNAVRLAFAFGPRHVRATVFLDVLDNHPGHVLAGGGLDAFQAR